MRGIELAVGGAAEPAAVFHVLQLAKETERTAPRNAGLGQVSGTGRIRARFLFAAEREVLAQCCLLPGHHHAHRRLARAGRGGQPAQDQRQQADPGRGLAAAAVDRMAAGDMPQFVRDHALNLGGRAGFLDQPLVDVNDLPARHERVDRRVAEQHHIDIARVEPGGADYRRRQFAQHRLGLGIAQHRLGQRGLHAKGERQQRR